MMAGRKRARGEGGRASDADADVEVEVDVDAAPKKRGRRRLQRGTAPPPQAHPTAVPPSTAAAPSSQPDDIADDVRTPLVAPPQKPFASALSVHRRLDPSSEAPGVARPPPSFNSPPINDSVADLNRAGGVERELGEANEESSHDGTDTTPSPLEPPRTTNDSPRISGWSSTVDSSAADARNHDFTAGAVPVRLRHWRWRRSCTVLSIFISAMLIASCAVALLALLLVQDHDWNLERAKLLAHLDRLQEEAQLSFQSVEQQAASCKMQLEKSGGTARSLRVEADGIQDRLNIALRRIWDLEADGALLAEELDVARGRIVSLQGTEADAVSALEAAWRRIDELVAEKHSASRERDGLSYRLGEVVQRTDALEASLDQTSNDIPALLKYVSQLSDEEESCRGLVHDLSHLNHQLASNLSDMEQKLHRQQLEAVGAVDAVATMAASQKAQEIQKLTAAMDARVEALLLEAVETVNFVASVANSQKALEMMDQAAEAAKAINAAVDVAKDRQVA